MAELITGRGGTDHVDSEDFGAFNAVTLGDGTYILSGCSMAMKTATTLHIAAGELLMQGRHVRIKGAGEDVDVAVGTTGYNRNDIVALHYKQEGGIESVSVEVVAGAPTTGAASDPELGGGSILNGDAEAYVAIGRVPIVGLAPSEPVVLVGGLKSNSQLAESVSALGDSVSRDGEWYVAKVGSAANIVFKHQVIKSLGFEQKEYVYNYDLPANCGTPVVGFVNATQWRVANARVTFPSSKEVRVVTPITKSVGSSGPDDIYYNDFDLTVICVK